MNIPTHNLKNQWRQYEQKHCWLASGIKDINGREIFEGDIVQLKDGKTYPVVFAEGMFSIDDAPLKLFAGDCAIVGHVAD